MTKPLWDQGALFIGKNVGGQKLQEDDLNETLMKLQSKMREDLKKFV
jgi:hypothetical protein